MHAYMLYESVGVRKEPYVDVDTSTWKKIGINNNNNNNNNVIIIIASHEDKMNDKYNDKLCTSNEVIQ